MSGLEPGDNAFDFRLKNANENTIIDLDNVMISNDSTFQTSWYGCLNVF